MFDTVGWGETGVLLVLALFVVGPDRLPDVVADAARALRRARRHLTRLTIDLKHELGPELGALGDTVKDLQTRSLVGSLLTDEPDRRLTGS